MNDELKLIQACVKGDKAKWDEFIRKYSRLIYNYIHSTAKIKGSQLTEEAVKDIFQGIFSRLIEDIYRRLKSFKAKNGCKLASWLRTITINYTLDHLSRTKPIISLDQEDDEGNSLKDVISANLVSQDEELVNKELLTQIMFCIEKMNYEEKYFIDLYIHKRLELGRIAEVLRISRGILDVRKTRIVAKLKECFKKKGFLIYPLFAVFLLGIIYQIWFFIF